MAAVVKVREKEKMHNSSVDPGKIGENNFTNGHSQLTIPLLNKHDGKLNNVVINIEKASKDSLQDKDLLKDIEDGEVIGIITLEDVFEELLQVTSRVSCYSYFLLQLIDIASSWAYKLSVITSLERVWLSW